MSQSPELQRRLTAWRNNKNDPKHAIALSAYYIQMGQHQSARGYYDKAKSVLKPWWNQISTLSDIHLLRATLRQQYHQFEPAITDLKAIIKKNMEHSQAWLMLSNIYRAKGQYGKAAAACSGLSRNANTVISTACLANVMALNGQEERAFQILSALQEQVKGSRLEQWILTSLGTISVQVGDYTQAKEFFGLAVNVGRRNTHLLQHYADLLLLTKDYPAVMILLQGESRDESLLLRTAIAAQFLGKETLANKIIDQLRGYSKVKELRGDEPRWLNKAMVASIFEHNEQQALEMALKSWENEKDLTAARFITRQALATKNEQAFTAMQQWSKRVRIKDKQLDALLGMTLSL